jgi:hypothetical protein
MNQRHLALLALVSASACAVVFTACGGDTANTDGGIDATTDVVGNDTAPPPDTGTDTGPNKDGGDAGPGNDAACPPGPGCRQCCVAANPDAAAIFFAAEETCACTTPGDCKGNNQCGNTLCKGQQASGPCDQCLNNAEAGACFTVAAAACIQNSACAPLTQCVAGCGNGTTDGGPTDAGGGG